MRLGERAKRPGHSFIHSSTHVPACQRECVRGAGISIGCLQVLELDAGFHRGVLPQSTDTMTAVAIVLAERGVAMTQAGAQCTLHAGEWTLVRCSHPATLHASGRVRIVVVPECALPSAPAQLFAGVLDRYACDEPINRVTFSMLWALCEEAAKLAPGDGHDLARAAVHVLKNALRDRAAHRHSDKTLLLQRVREFVDWHLREPDLSIGRVARALNCTDRSIQRAFQAQGETFARYLMRLRLERCRRDLLSPRLAHQSVTQTAFSYGFVNLAHFSRAYKEMFGKSPRSVRALNTAHAAGVDSAQSLASDPKEALIYRLP